MATLELLQFFATGRRSLQSLQKLWRRCVEEPAAEEVWEGFFAYASPYMLAIIKRRAVARGVQLREGVIEEIFQETCLKISQHSRKLPEMVLRTEESALAYLSAIVANDARDAMRSRFAGKRNQQMTNSLDDHCHTLIDAIGTASADRAVLLRQIETALDATTRDRSIFWLYYKQGFTATEIAKIPSVRLSAKGVESLIGRLIVQIRHKLDGVKTSAAGGGD